jgi:hypothetical protein
MDEPVSTKGFDEGVTLLFHFILLPPSLCERCPGNKSCPLSQRKRQEKCSGSIYSVPESTRVDFETSQEEFEPSQTDLKVEEESIANKEEWSTFLDTFFLLN